MNVLGFYELLDEDRPPERIWLDDEALEAHWSSVTARREAGSRGVESVPAAPLEQNELTRDLKR
jgi:hypothetical protein